MSWNALSLHELDNVAVVLREITAGEEALVKSPSGICRIEALDAIPFCHKVALSNIEKGAPVYRYGQCIGEAVETIRRGAWVHTHNLVSRRARPEPANRMTEAEVEALAETMAGILRIAISPEQLEGVRANLWRLAECAEIVATRPPPAAASPIERS